MTAVGPYTREQSCGWTEISLPPWRTRIAAGKESRQAVARNHGAESDATALRLGHTLTDAQQIRRIDDCVASSREGHRSPRSDPA